MTRYKECICIENFDAIGNNNDYYEGTKYNYCMDYEYDNINKNQYCILEDEKVDFINKKDFKKYFDINEDVIKKYVRTTKINNIIDNYF